MNDYTSKIRLIKLGIDTYLEPIIYMHENCHVCRSEGFVAPARIEVSLNNRSLIATLNTVNSTILQCGEASLSNYAWDFLNAKPGDEITVSHPKPLNSLSYIRSKIYGNRLKKNEINEIISDITAGRLSDINIAMFLSATANGHFNTRETLDLTHAMINTGEQLSWPSQLIVDKHCIGGLPGNRTTPIIVAIVSAFGLMIPKTSSRAITSPAGTADTMEVFAPVNLDINTMRKVVEKENGCIVWGKNASLSPADDILIRVERVMNLDSKGQLVASILSKKIAAGSNHLVIDMPVGPTAKVRSLNQANKLKNTLENIAKFFSLNLTVVTSDGTQPVGRGIGPALEAKDILSVLMNSEDAPQDLKTRALTLAGHLIEFSPNVKPGEGKLIARDILEGGMALKKFEAICEAQGGMRTIPTAKYTHAIHADHDGKICEINNRLIARIAKFAGAPTYKAAGVELLVKTNTQITKGDPLFIIHSEAEGELQYTLSYLKQGHQIFKIER